MKSFRSIFFILPFLLLVTACEQGNSKDSKPKIEVRLVKEVDFQGTPDVVAKIGSQEIRDQEVRGNSDVKNRLYQAELGVYQAEKRVHDTFKDALEDMIEERLTKEAATTKKTTVEELMKKEVNDKAKKVTDAEAKKFYDEKKIDRPFDQIKDRIKEYLANQKLEERRKAFIDELKKKNKVEIKVAEFGKAKPLPPKSEINIAADELFRGPATAPVTIIEFSDFQCPHCKNGAATLKEVMAKYKDKVRVLHRHYPLPFHNDAVPAAVASECAKEQGKFWEYSDVLWANQQKLKQDDLIKYASDLKLNKDNFVACLGSKKYEKMIEASMEEGKKLGVNGTPAFFVNGRLISGARPVEDFDELIQIELPGAAASKKSGS